jgi:bacterioferritin
VNAGAIKQKVLGYLGRALSLELSAVQMYSTQARYVGNLGLDKASKRLRHEATEETEHVERIIARMLALGAVPGASQLRPVCLGNNLISILTSNRDFEIELVNLYQDAVTYCSLNGNDDDRIFFQTLLSEEQKHEVEITEWITSIKEVDAVSKYNR